MINSMTTKEIVELTGVTLATAWRHKNKINSKFDNIRAKIQTLVECDRKKRADKYLDLIIDIYKLSNFNVEIKELIESRMKRIKDEMK